MMLSMFQEFPQEEQKRIYVQKAVNCFKEKVDYENNVKTFFLTNYTLNGIESFQSYYLYKKSISPVVEFSDFNAVVQTLLNEKSKLHEFSPDFVVLSLDLRIFVKDFSLNEWDLNIILLELMKILDLVKKAIKVPVIVTDFFLPAVNLMKNSTGDTLDKKVNKLNLELSEYIQSNSKEFFLVELSKMVGFVGNKNSIDDRLWYKNKAPFKSPLLASLAREISTIISSHYGHSKKCIILDCDNTLWGGVVGEDGLDGIALDPNEYPGVAYFEFQSYLLSLYKQGILLAICSKNNEEDVLAVLENHPNCLLKREHFVVIKANWNKKYMSVMEISSQLRLGMNNFVFVDDSDVECSLIQEFIPDLDVIQTPKNPSELSHIWNSENLFYLPQKTKEDERKQTLYKDDFSRQKSSEDFEDISTFLKTLQTSVEFFEKEETQLERIAQLTQKTNQFNLRTIRYTTLNIESFIKSDNHVIFSMRVKDKFGDLGITNVAIFNFDKKNVAFLDTFLMSCRVIQRDLEYCFLQHCANTLRDNYDVKVIEAEFVPSKKNSLAKNFLAKVGFKLCVDTNGNDTDKYYGNILDMAPFSSDHINTIRVGN